MSQIGYYRYKVNPAQNNTISFFVNGVLTTSHNILVKEYCGAELLIKYLDSNGQYRFYPFNKFYQKQDNPTLLGKYNKLVTSLLTGQSSERNLGYKNERVIIANADVTARELELLKDLYTSPSVYLYVGNGSNDGYADWLEVTIKSRENANNIRKGNMINISITVTLPEHYTITRL